MKVKDLQDKIYSNSDDSLIEFINKEFVQIRSISIMQYKGNLDTLKKLDSNTKVTGIARMEILQEENDTSKFIAFLVALLLAILTSYSKIIEQLLGVGLFSAFINAAFILGYFALANISIKKSNEKKLRAMYFKRLLETM